MHYMILTLFPLIVVMILFFYFESNVAEFHKQSLGIKFGGPIAAYAGLVFILKMILDQLFETLRKEDEHRKKILLNVLPVEKAISECEGFSELLARYIVVDVIRAGMRGFTQEHVTQITSTVRKKLYRFTDSFGNLSIDDGKYELSQLVAAALNNAEFVSILNNAISTTLSNNVSEKKELDNPAFNLPGIQVATMHDYSVVPLNSSITEKDLSTVLLSFDIDLQTETFKNIIWRQCESSIKNPAVAMQSKLMKP